MAKLQGEKVSGAIEFTAEEGGVRVAGTVEGLTAGKHGFHIHEVGKCEAPDFKSAGGHFTGGAAKHGAPDGDMHHAGDFGNIIAGDDGKAEINFVSGDITLEEGTEKGIVGRAVIVHAGEDDLNSQPSGAAGARAACGLILATE